MKHPAVKSAAGGAFHEHLGSGKEVKEEAADLVALSLHCLEVLRRQCILRSKKNTLSVTACVFLSVKGCNILSL